MIYYIVIQGDISNNTRSVTHMCAGDFFAHRQVRLSRTDYQLVIGRWCWRWHEAVTGYRLQGHKSGTQLLVPHSSSSSRRQCAVYIPIYTVHSLTYYLLH